MKKVINRAFTAKKKIIILAISAMLAVNISAQAQKKEGNQFTKEERVELNIKNLTLELLLSDQQAKKFAETYREYAAVKEELFEKDAKEKMDPGKELTEDAELDKMAKKHFEEMKKFADLQAKYYDKFRKFLSARQVEKVLHLSDAFGHNACCGNHGNHHCGNHDHHAGKPAKPSHKK
jgi:hypothetical protein